MKGYQIDIAKNFSRTPAGRYQTDGLKSGESFRKECLLPALQNSDSVVVHIDGIEGYGSSFLEEAFGGLVRVEGFTRETLHRCLEIESIDEAWKQEICSYIDQAK